jgi:hypothetical protein
MNILPAATSAAGIFKDLNQGGHAREYEKRQEKN